MPDDPHDRYDSLRQVGLLATIPFLLLAAPVVGFVLGRLLDHWLRTSFLTWVFLALGMVAAVREVIRVLRRAGSDEKSGDKP
jgi:F0F1-type ATP synthase assembly protein I